MVSIRVSAIDLLSLKAGARASNDVGDEGENFVEEAVGFLREEELETIALAYGGLVEDFFLGVFSNWNGDEDSDIVELFSDELAQLNLVFEMEDDAISSVFEEVDEWDHDLEVDDEVEMEDETRDFDFG
jgi:hypothetical protein